MSFLWPGKNEPGSDAKIDTPDLPTTVAEDDAGDLHALTNQLTKLGQLLDQANGQLSAYLVRRESQAAAGPIGKSEAGTVTEHVDALAKRLEELNAKVDALGEAAGAAAGPAPDTLTAAIVQLSDAINEMKESLAGAFRQLRKRVDDGLAELAGYLRPAKPEEPASGDAGDDWARTILGPALAEDPALGFQRQQFLNGALQGEAGARALAGQLLVFQSAPPEKMPALLKEIGEAYYRWQPKRAPGANEMEEALAAWLQRACDRAGILNTIELVHPGEHFDSTRHTAVGRGVEISEVFGWIVLRDNGKVYTKASVAVK